MIRRNILANIAARVWGVVSSYCFVPLYLKFLGIEAYGLVGFYATLAGVLAFADLGFSATLNRELARLAVRKDSAGEMRDLLRTYEIAYLGISFLAAVSLWTLAPLIAEHWLRSQVLSPAEMSSAIRLMGVAIALQMPMGLYVGGLMGLERQVRANTLQMAWGALRGIGAVLVLWLYAPTIFAFALWQLLSNAIYLLLARVSLWRVLSPDTSQPRPRFKRQVFRDTWRYATGMAGTGLISMVLLQADKLTVSKLLPLEIFAYYTLAGVLASVPLMLASPISSAVFPRLTGLVALGDHTGLARLYHRSCELVAVAIIPAGLVLALFAREFVFAWTGSIAAAEQAGTVGSLLIIGQLIQASSLIPCNLLLANGAIRLLLQIGIAQAIVITPLLVLLILKYGVVGAGISWMVLNLCSLPPCMYLVHRRFLVGELRRWWLRSMLRPLLVALPCVVLGRWLTPHTDSRFLTLCSIGLVWAVAAGATAAGVPELRDLALKQTRRMLGI
jgi:O-antigen/teichoic acid export membrane protein